MFISLLTILLSTISTLRNGTRDSNGVSERGFEETRNPDLALTRERGFEVYPVTSVDSKYFKATHLNFNTIY